MGFPCYFVELSSHLNIFPFFFFFFFLFLGWGGGRWDVVENISLDKVFDFLMNSVIFLFAIQDYIYVLLLCHCLRKPLL